MISPVAARLRAIPGINRNSLLFLLHSGIYHIGLFGISDVLLNFYFVSLGYSAETIGVLQGIPKIGGFLAGIPIGILAERLGARRVATYGMFGVALTYIPLVLTGSVSVLVATRFLFGIVYVATNIAAAPLMMQLTETRFQIHLFAHFNVITMLAVTVGSLIGGYLPGWGARLLGTPLLPNGGQSAVAYAFGLAVAGFVILFSLLPMIWLRTSERAGKEPPRGDGARSGHDLTGSENAPINWPRLMVLGSPFLLFGITAGLTFPFYNLFFRDTFRLSDETVGAVLSIGWTGMAFVTFANPWLERTFGRAKALAVTLTIAAVAFLIMGNAPTLGIAIVAYTVAASARNTMGPLFSPLMMDRIPGTQHNRASALTSVFWSLGYFGATSASGILQERSGYPLIFGLVAVGIFLTGLSTALIYRDPVDAVGRQ